MNAWSRHALWNRRGGCLVGCDAKGSSADVAGGTMCVYACDGSRIDGFYINAAMTFISSVDFCHLSFHKFNMIVRSIFCLFF